ESKLEAEEFTSRLYKELNSSPQPYLVLQPQQQRAILRPQVSLPTSPMMAVRNPSPGRMAVGQQQVQLKELQPGTEEQAQRSGWHFQMQQQELAQMRQREANLTALAAIGPRKKRKNLGSPSSASAEGSGTGSSLTGAAGSSGSRPTRQRITRVNLRDLLFCLEDERFTSHSHFLYKGFLK
ncbi:hypothetical protein GOODEAATRI_012001, partial [Goodea atripinnis]